MLNLEMPNSDYCGAYLGAQEFTGTVIRKCSETSLTYLQSRNTKSTFEEFSSHPVAKIIDLIENETKRKNRNKFR